MKYSDWLVQKEILDQLPAPLLDRLPPEAIKADLNSIPIPELLEMGLETEDLEEQIEDLEEQIRDLKEEIEGLEHQILYQRPHEDLHDALVEVLEPLLDDILDRVEEHADKTEAWDLFESVVDVAAQMKRSFHNTFASYDP